MTARPQPAQRRRAADLTRALIGTLAVAATAIALVQVPATAQGTDEPRVRLSVPQLSGVLGPGSVELSSEEVLDPDDPAQGPTELRLRALVENLGDRPIDSLRLVIEVYPAATSRSDLRASLAGSPAAEPILIDDPGLRPGGRLEPGSIAGSARSYESEQIPWAENGGVHPIRIAVTRGTELLDEVMTSVVWVAEPPPETVSTVMVWPLDETPWRGAEGMYPSGIDRSIRDGGRLDGLLRVLERQPEAPVVLAAAPHLLEDLRDRADGFTTLERIEGGSQEARAVQPEDDEARRANDLLRRIRGLATELVHPPISGTYAGADLAAMHATRNPGTRTLAGDAAGIGRQRTQGELARITDGGVHLLQGAITPEVLDLLPGDQLLMPYNATVAPPIELDPDLGEPLRNLRSPAGRSLSAMVGDPYLTELLSRPDDAGGPIVAAQRVVAETAMIHFEAPSSAGRSVLLLPEHDWDPGLETAALILDGLMAAPWLSLDSAGAAVAESRRAPGEPEMAIPEAGDFPGSFASELEAAIGELEAAQAMLPEGEETIGGRSPEDLRDALLRSTSGWLRSQDQSAAEPLVRDVRRAAAETFGDITVSESNVTLTSDSGQVPITLQRSRGGPVAVQVEVASQGRLIWPEGRRSETIILTEDDSTTITFATQALSTGTFPVTVTVLDPSGKYPLYNTTLTVNSTAISGPALAGISALVVVLLLIGALRRRRPSTELAVVPSEPGRPLAPDTRY